ncbi:MAG: shikimate kinase [Cardiobacteriaceae bacterium]|nr:shikimate kinase [Cardiobacteriaceae bacterium]
MHDRKIMMIGPMGAGKTSLGKRLANRLRWRFVDTDQALIARTGVDIPTIFAQEGEEGFRRREHEMLCDILQKPHDTVVACGGGIVLDPRNRELIGKQALVIFLDVSVERQIERIGQDRNRPLIHAADQRQHLLDMRSVRLPLYKSLADITVSTDGNNFSRTFHALLDKVEKYLAETPMR